MKLAFRIVDPKEDSPVLVIVGMSGMIVLMMCPLMSPVATLLFQYPGGQWPAIWVQTTILNFPMALLWQLFLAGPLVRSLFERAVGEAK